MRLVGDLMRGLSVNEAEAQLLHERRRAARPLLKLLRSAVADIKNSKKPLAIEKLYVQSIRVDQGPMLKRMLPRARGMATPIQKKTSHITLVLAESAKPLKSRYTIVVPKKTKLPPEERPTGKKKPERKEGGRDVTAEARRERGFFRKMFSRKSV
jgi:large subunit ribosomal protein L22